MKTIRVLIADDEAVARDLLRSMLREHPGVEIVAECADGCAALQAIRRKRPDVALLDIRMPELNGLEVAGSLEPAEAPEIVFVTAYDKFAVDAFDLHALDYLLKPFDERRLSRALDRVRERLSEKRSADASQRLDAFLSRLDDIGRPLERVAVKRGTETVVVRFRDVDWIESEANYVRLHGGADSFLLRSTLSGLEARLDRRRFVRIHRGVIVNVDRIDRMFPQGHGDYRVRLQDGTELRLSRRFKDRLDRQLGSAR